MNNKIINGIQHECEVGQAVKFPHVRDKQVCWSGRKPVVMPTIIESKYSTLR